MPKVPDLHFRRRGTHFRRVTEALLACKPGISGVGVKFAIIPKQFGASSAQPFARRESAKLKLTLSEAMGFSSLLTAGRGNKTS
jgi:hypothetical protein